MDLAHEPGGEEKKESERSEGENENATRLKPKRKPETLERHQ